MTIGGAKTLVIPRYSEGSRNRTSLSIPRSLGVPRDDNWHFVIYTFELRHSFVIRVSSFVIPYPALTSSPQTHTACHRRESAACHRSRRWSRGRCCCLRDSCAPGPCRHQEKRPRRRRWCSCSRSCRQRRLGWNERRRDGR